MTGDTDADRRSAPFDGTDRELGHRREDAEERRDDDAKRHAARAALYGLLGGCFVYPDDDTLAELTAPDARDGVRRAAERLGLEDEVAELLESLEGADTEALEGSYNALFDLPEGGEYAVIPYEAHYTTGSEVSEEQRRIATVAGLAEQFGVEHASDERQDHVAAELELMQVVAAQRAAAAYRGESETARNLGAAEATILDRHLIGFVPALAHELRAATDSDVYRTAATLAERLIRRDHQRHQEREDDGAIPEVVDGD